RGVMVRLGDSWQTIRDNGHYPPAIAELLGQVCAATALFTGHTKIDGMLSVQLRGDGPIQMLFSECTGAGRLRAIARFDEPLPERLGPRDFGRSALLAVTIESTPPGHHEPTRYQGLVGLDTDTLAQAFEGYFDQSEQLPTRIALAADRTQSVGLMIQQLPGTEGDPDGWNRANLLFDTVTGSDLLATRDGALLHQLFHEDGVRILGQRSLAFGCSCSRDRVATVLTQLGHEEALAAIVDGEHAQITCEFCHRVYRFDRIDIEALFAAPTGSAPAGLQ
ncbi:MAG: heat-shock protein Hsp33, partial [Gammaproteobacteria bacterium HGW-Gammaproteobacteria-7]